MTFLRSLRYGMTVRRATAAVRSDEGTSVIVYLSGSARLKSVVDKATVDAKSQNQSLYSS